MSNDRLGGNQKRIFEVTKSTNDYHAFVELHIEQGNILNKNNIDIGVVTGIVGLKWWDVTITGFANHAGTTPMDERKDPMITAADFILLVRGVISETPGNQVGTVGKIEALPGFKPSKPVVFCGLFPVDSSEYLSLIHI